MNTAKIELHLHLDGSLNIRWAYEQSLRQKIIDSSSTFEDYYHMLYQNNFAARQVSITKFDLVCNILQHYEDLFDAAYDLVKRLHEMGIIYAEIRFASQQHTKCGLTQLEALQAVTDGAARAMEDFPDIRIGIINCLMHKGDSASFNMKENMETVEVTKQLLGKGAVALDLAGFENNCPYRDYAPLFEAARQAGIPYTMHAGEMGDGSHIMDALDMGAYRIGHGINCIQDEKWLNAVVSRQIPLEVCVTSNIKNTLDYSSHPVRHLMEKGVKVTLNTDNMIFAKSNLQNEHFQLKMIGVTDEQLIRCTYNAAEAAFCDEQTRKWITDCLDKEFRL